jgi:hypothetical protein
VIPPGSTIPAEAWPLRKSVGTTTVISGRKEEALGMFTPGANDVKRAPNRRFIERLAQKG